MLFLMKLILLVQSTEDVEKLLPSAEAIKAAGYTGVWVNHSPAVAVNQKEAAAQFDKEIDELQAAEAASASRGDYEAAKGYKVSREGKILDRAKALRDAWKGMSSEDREKRITEIFEPFVKALNPDGGNAISTKVTEHSDHYDPAQWVSMLNSLSGAWFTPFVPGSFSIAWPGAIPKTNSITCYPRPDVATAIEMITGQKVDVRIEGNQLTATPKETKTQKPTFANRADELTAMRYFTLKKVADPLGVSMPKGKPLATVVQEILAAEAAKAA